MDSYSALWRSVWRLNIGLACVFMGEKVSQLVQEQYCRSIILIIFHLINRFSGSMLNSVSCRLARHLKRLSRRFLSSNESSVQYVQGQSPEPKIREYFYYIDHQGMLFLDDSRMKNFTSCFKEKKFLQFFFTRLKLNTTDRYHPAFPFISPCGRERNFVRCDDQPFVYTHVLGDPEHKQALSYGHAGDLLTVPFQPDHIFVHPVSGRVYHPAPEKVGGIGLVRSQLAIEFSQHFVFKDGKPVGFNWAGRKHTLQTDWVPKGAQFNLAQEEF
ncbi:UPF0598 protein CG30010 [Cloeon dipterum]|uniref:UPF0598 protein CG30010 n=1 Tax=Cloeon dipterum TaxID=197152 RepID=UPI00322061D2